MELSDEEAHKLTVAADLILRIVSASSQQADSSITIPYVDDLRKTYPEAHFLSDADIREGALFLGRLAVLSVCIKRST